MMLWSTRLNERKNNEYIGKTVFVLSYLFKDIEQNFDVFDNLEESKKAYNKLEQNKDYNYDIKKCIVTEDSLEEIY